MIAVVAEFKVALSGAGNFRALAEQHAHRCLEREPGCQQFDITQDPADPEQWLFYERYRRGCARRASQDRLPAEIHRGDAALRVGRKGAPLRHTRRHAQTLRKSTRRSGLVLENRARRASSPRTPCESWSGSKRP